MAIKRGSIDSLKRKRMNPYLLRPVVAIGLLLLMLTAGCVASTSTVSGKVVYQGQPLTSGTVTLYGANGAVHASLLDAGGCYSIPGVGRGPAKVTVTTHAAIPAGFEKVQPHPDFKPAFKVVLPGSEPGGAGAKACGYVRIPEKYGNPDQSGLTLEVTGGLQTFDIKLNP
jgi:hypothetical protein